MALPPSRSAPPPSPSAPRKPAPWKLIVSLSATVIALLAGGLWLKGWLAVPNDATVRQLLAAAVPDQLPWDIAALTAEKFANNDGTATARFTAGMRLREDLFSEIRPTEMDVAKDYPDGLGQPIAGWTAWMRERVDALEPPEREPLVAQLAERGWWSADAGRPRVNIFDRAVLKKITDAGREVTVYGTLTVSKNSGGWRTVSVSADWQPLRLGARHADGEKQVIAGTDEFKAWAARVVERGAEIEKMAADAEQRQRQRREKIAREFVTEKLPGDLPWSVKSLTLTLTGSGGAESFEAVLAATAELFAPAADSEVAAQFDAAKLALPDAAALTARVAKLDAAERGPLAAELQARELLATGGALTAKIFDEKIVLKKTATVGDEVTVSGTLLTKIEGGAWSAAGVAVDRAALQTSGPRGAAPSVVIGSGEFQVWMNSAAARGSTFEKLLAASEEKQASRKAAETQVAAARAAETARQADAIKAEQERKEREQREWEHPAPNAVGLVDGLYAYMQSETHWRHKPFDAVNDGNLTSNYWYVIKGAEFERYRRSEMKFKSDPSLNRFLDALMVKRSEKPGGTFVIKATGTIERVSDSEYVFHFKDAVLTEFSPEVETVSRQDLRDFQKANGSSTRRSYVGGRIIESEGAKAVFERVRQLPWSPSAANGQ